MIRHLVHLRFRESVSPGDRARLYVRLADLRGHLGGIEDFGHRRNISPETPVVRGFRDMFWFDFRDAAARDAYLADPGHRAVGADLAAACEGGVDGIFVCDVEI